MVQDISNRLTYSHNSSLESALPAQQSPASEPLDYDPVRGERALWQAVLTQALMDARCESKKSEFRQHKHQAIRWLLGRSEDFFWVCNLADLDPHYVLQKNREALSRNCRWRAEAGHKSSVAKEVTHGI